jgi:hypothetical protein
MIEAGLQVENNLKLVNGVLVLVINVNGQLYEWTSSTFVIASNRQRMYDIPTLLVNAIYLTGNRFTPIYRYFQLLGAYLLSKSTFFRRTETQLKPMVTRYYGHQHSYILTEHPDQVAKVSSLHQNPIRRAAQSLAA